MVENAVVLAWLLVRYLWPLVVRLVAVMVVLMMRVVVVHVLLCAYQVAVL